MSVIIYTPHARPICSTVQSVPLTVILEGRKNKNKDFSVYSILRNTFSLSMRKKKENILLCCQYAQYRNDKKGVVPWK
jgi:hypothetical protein